MAKNNAKLVDPNMLIQAGINPETGLPIKLDMISGCMLKENIKRSLTILDEIDAINRYTWYNLPNGLTPQLIERVLYYRGQGMLFKLDDKYYFLPYTLDGTIDVYGRFTGVTPLPFNGTANDGDPENPWIQGLVFNPVYETPNLLDFAGKSAEQLDDYLAHACVLLHDVSPAISQTNISRSIMQEPIVDLMSDCLPFLRTALLNSTGVLGMRVSSEDEVPQVKAASNAINKAALVGEKYVGIAGRVEFQELTGGAVGKAEEFLLSMQSLDNFRLSMYGLETGGLFQKKSHMLESEQQMNAGNASLMLLDGLRNRQDFAILVNIIFGEAIWCEVSEPVLGVDMTGDGVATGDQSMSYENELDGGTEDVE